MATAYKTPGVYIEEIPKFPPSIAPVETAIPAFIGYTEKATALIDGDLRLKPKRISSMVEYEAFFGFAQPEERMSVAVTETKDASKNILGLSSVARLAEDERSKHIMYYALQLFFANGGGPCYVVSVGGFKTSFRGDLIESEMEDGLKKIALEDEPTLIVFPEAQSLTIADFKTLHDAALTQCAKLKDRFVIMDLHGDPKVVSPTSPKLFLSNPVTNLIDAVSNFRSFGISNDNLKYGAAYAPNIETTLDFLVNESKTEVTRQVVSPAANVASLALAAAKAATASLIASNTVEVGNAITAAATAVNSLVTLDTADPAAAAMASAVAAQVVSLITAAAALPSTPATITLLSTAAAAGSVATLASKVAAIAVATAATASGDTATAAAATTAASDATTAAGVLTTTPTAANAQLAATAAAAAVAIATPKLSALASAKNAIYESARAAIRDLPCKMPPSSSVAGIYASVDNERGVWKTPANRSMNAVIRPTIAFSNVEQDQMNVDVAAGKSVNAIRAFTGKGTLVWGGRTLAGNDNEWRYVSVRRFFNFVEESVKKATEQFVFEPNDANTWVRVQAMNENFLTTLWRQGALQGIKPEHAFYVAVGLGKTMTALDILEGRMIVEIGMAAVRPAEFIILRFSHKMAES